MPAEDWIFSEEEMEDTPTIRISRLIRREENIIRQETATFILVLGRVLQMDPTCIRTAMVYMHRFYMMYSVMDLTQTAIATACISLASKIDKGEGLIATDIIRALDFCIEGPQYTNDECVLLCSELFMNEGCLIDIFGDNLLVEHPHMYIVGTVNQIEESERLTKASYFMASYSIRKTTLCLQYPPTIVACVCIYAASIVECLEIPHSINGYHWFMIIHGSITEEEVQQISEEFMPELKYYHPTLRDLEQPNKNIRLPLLSPYSMPIKGTKGKFHF